MPQNSKEFIDAIKKFSESVDKLTSITERANDMGYVGDIGVTPMFSEEVRKSREELANFKTEFEDLSIRFSEGLKIEEGLDSMRSLRREMRKAIKEFKEASSAGDDDAKAEANKKVESLRKQIEGIKKAKADFKKEYGFDLSKEEDRVRLEEEVNQKMIEGLIKRNEENKLLGRINKELAYRNKAEEEGVTIQERMVHVLDNSFVNVAKFRNGINEIKQGFNGVLGTVKGIIEPWGKLNQAAADYAKSIGMSHDRFRELQRTINATARERQLAAKYGIGDVEAIKTQQNITLSVGRQIGFSGDQLEDAAALQRMVGGEGAANYISQLEKFGLSQSEVANRVNEMFKDSEKSGIAFDKYSKIMLDNIKMAQTYTFSKGVNGLSEMAKRSAEISMNLGEVAKYADKISTVEGATQAAAGLSVLGGNFALGANPLAMLYNGLNSMEGVQGQMENMLKGLVTYNEEKQQLEMNAYDRMRLRQASQIMGVDYNNMVESAYAMGRENLVSNAVVGKGIGRDSREYQALINRSFIKNGEAYVNVDNKEVAVKDLSNEQISRVVQTDFKEEDGIRKIAETMLGFQDKIDAIQKAKENELTYWTEVSHIGDAADKMLDLVRENAKWLALLQGTSSAILAAVSLTGMGNGVFNTASAFGRRGSVLATPPKGASGVNMSTRLTPSPGRLIPNTTPIVGGSGVTEGTGSTGSAAGTAGRAAMGTASKVGMAGIGGLVGYGLGSAVGGYAEYKIAGNADKELYSRDEEIRENAITKKAVGSAANNALTWGATGLGIGMAFGPMGAIVGGAAGALAGAVGGGLYGYYNAKSESEKGRLLKLIKNNDGIVLEGDYSTEDLRTILGGPDAIGRDESLMKKLRTYEGVDNFSSFKKVEGYKNGGIIRGRGSGVSDSNLAWVSNNEYIMPADKTLKPNNRVILDSMRSGDNLIPKFKDGGSVKITPTGNRLDVMKVNDNHSNFGLQSPSIGTTKVELSPLTINGSIEFKMNGQTKNIDPNDILNNPVLMRQITDIIAKNLNRQHNYGFEKNEFYKKF